MHAQRRISNTSRCSADALPIDVSFPDFLARIVSRQAIFTKSGMTCKEYPYFHPPTKGFDFDGMMKAIATHDV